MTSCDDGLVSLVKGREFSQYPWTEIWVSSAYGVNVFPETDMFELILRLLVAELYGRVRREWTNPRLVQIRIR